MYSVLAVCLCLTLANHGDDDDDDDDHRRCRRRIAVIGIIKYSHVGIYSHFLELCPYSLKIVSK